MPGPIARLYATLGLDTKGFTKGVDTAQSKTKQLTSGFKQQAMAGLGLGVGLGAVGVAAIGVSKAIGFVGDSIGAAVEESKGIATLTQAIEANDAAWNGNVDAVEEVIRARTELAFADDEQRDSLQRLVSVTGDVNKALELQRTAMDLARLRGMDLATAGDLIGKVYAGNLGTLSRYGIVLEKGTTATEALAEIQRRAAGQAEAYADTVGGQIEASQLALNDAMEDFGAALLPLVTELMPHFIRLVDGMAEGAKILDDVLSGGDAGPLSGLVDGMKTAREEMADLAAEQQQLSGEWAASGTPIDSALDGVNSLMGALEGVSPARQEALRWEAELKPLADQLGATEDDLNAFRFEAEAAGLTLEQALAKLRSFADEKLWDAFDPLAGATITPPDIVGPIEEEFAAARQAIKAGFGSVKEALKNPPQLISRADRIENMEERQKRTTRELNRAVEADDPWNIAYWTKAAAKQQTQLDTMRGKGRTTTEDVARDFAGMGLDIQGTMFDLPRYAKTAAEGVKAAFTSQDMMAVGVGMAQGVAAGITAGAPAMSAAAAAAANGARLAAGVGASGGVGGTNININGNVYGGKAGTRQLAGDIERATRPTQRNRRHNNLAEG